MGTSTQGRGHGRDTLRDVLMTTTELFSHKKVSLSFVFNSSDRYIRCWELWGLVYEIVFETRVRDYDICRGTIKSVNSVFFEEGKG